MLLQLKMKNKNQATSAKNKAWTSSWISGQTSSQTSGRTSGAGYPAGYPAGHRARCWAGFPSSHSRFPNFPILLIKNQFFNRKKL